MGIYRDDNKVREYNIDEAIKLVTLKLVGYTECVHVLVPKMRENASILVFGGLAKDQPYSGSVTITTVNGAMSTLINSLAIELSPISSQCYPPWSGWRYTYLDSKTERSDRQLNFSHCDGSAGNRRRGDRCCCVPAGERWR